MGGLVIETVRPGVQFVPDAAAAFRRADARVVAKYGRHIDVNSTYRSRATQLAMYNAWQWYLRGGPYPGHSKALHPDDPLAFHVQGTAVDSDDWSVPGIVEILADEGFIRNRLYVPNEKHHFEWLRNRDNHYGEPIAAAASTTSTPLKEDDMKMIGNNADGYKLVDEFGADNIASFMYVQNGATFYQNLEALEILAEKQDVSGGWPLELVRHIANARWDQKRGQIVTDVVNSLRPLLAEISKAVAGVSAERFAELIEAGLEGVVVKAAPISDADRDAIAEVVREKFREEPLS